MSDARVRAPAPDAAFRALLFPLLALLSILPIGTLIVTALRPASLYPALWLQDGWSITDSMQVLASPAVWGALGRSLILAVLTGVFGCVIAFFAARTLARATRTVQRVGAALAFLPVIAPPIALGVGVQVFALRLGVGGSMIGVLLAHLIPACGYLTLFLLGVLRSYDDAMEEGAQTLGATAYQVFVRVTLPSLRPQLMAAVVLGALVSWGQLALTLLVGAGVVRTLPVELLSFVRAGDDRLGAAAALLLSVPPLIALSVVQSGVRRTGAVS